MMKLDGVDLFNFITEAGPFTDAMTKGLFRQLLTTVISCHQRGVLHRDIQDANILLNLDTREIKPINFGSSAILLKCKLYCEREGTKAYFPPDWFLYGSYRAKGLTVWSLDILLFDVLSGNLPWDNATKRIGNETPWLEGLVLSREA